MWNWDGRLAAFNTVKCGLDVRTFAIWGLCRIRLIVAIRAKMVGAARIVGVDIKGPEKIISKCINKSIIHAKHRGVTGSINFKDHMGLHRII